MSEDAKSEVTNPHTLVTEDHVKGALKKDKGQRAKLLSWSFEDFTEKGDNYATVVTSIKVSYALEAQTCETSYIVKINPNRGFGPLKDFFTMLFQKEGGFYEKIVPLINAELTNVGLKELRIPKWLYNSLENKKEVIFLEDLRLRGFKMFDRKKGMDVPHTLLVLKELARFHGASLMLLENQPWENLLEKYNFLKLDWHHYEGNVEENMKMIFEPNFDLTAELLRRIGGYEVVEKWLTENKGDTVKLLKTQLSRDPPFLTICHGDCWNNNMLFRYNDKEEPVEVMLVDLQITRIASPATDLNYLLYTSLTGEGRRANINQFLQSYYKSFSDLLEAAGKATPFTDQELSQEFRKRHVYGLIFGMLCSTIIVRPKEDVPDFDKEVQGEEEMAKLMEEYRENCLKMMENNPLFKPRFAAIFDDMIENGVFD